MAVMVGIGAAAAIGGAVLGTILPQVSATINLLNLQTASASDFTPWMINQLIIFVGTLTAFASFHFTTRRSTQAAEPTSWLFWVNQIGKGFVALALGVIFAGVFATALAAFVSRVAFIWDFIWALIGLS
jgi:hypothetical protein